MMPTTVSSSASHTEEAALTFSIRFCGATRTVTGSCFLIRTPKCQLLVDCGLFQGHKTLKQLNYRSFPFDPGSIDLVLLTHAHIDHSGLLPILWKGGFKGPVFMTRGTRHLLSFMLPDSGHIREMDVENLNRRYSRRDKPQVEPIYTRQDAEFCQESFRTVEYATWAEVGEGVRARYWNAGHILGSASIEIATDATGMASGSSDFRSPATSGRSTSCSSPIPMRPTRSITSSASRPMEGGTGLARRPMNGAPGSHGRSRAPCALTASC
jgi:predicted metal-dependent RNase